MLEVKNLAKTFKTDEGRVGAVQGISFQVPPAKIFTLLGPSGCGKTTTLRCVAGLEVPDGGEILIEGQPVFSQEKNIFVPPHRRGIGMVFQSYAIWPHMNVFENVAFPFRVAKQKPKEAEIRERVRKALELVGLAGLERRPATKLSGGQQQRLALARALVNQPGVLLLDEPLSNLDAKLREHMRLELLRLQRAVGITTLYVTHDQVEALALSDYVGVMRDGRLLQVGTPKEIYEKPNCQFVANFIGTTNFIPCEKPVPLDGSQYYQVQTALGPLRCRSSAGGRPLEGSVLVSIRPEFIELTSQEGQTNCFPAVVVNAVFLGEFIDCQVEAKGVTLRLRLHPSQAVQAGEKVIVHLPPENSVLIPLEGGEVQNLEAAL